MQPAVLFYSESCPRCVGVISAVAIACDQKKIPLHVRKPTLNESMMPGFAYPALWLPQSLTRSGKDVILVGDKLLAALFDVLGFNPVVNS